jgi:hypothetical protein
MYRNNEYSRVAFRERPLLGVLLFDNVVSDARDHAANERSALLLKCGLRDWLTSGKLSYHG